jgi:antitoxin component YwqK of YwqJK toxin-antitoxin module
MNSKILFLLSFVIFFSCSTTKGIKENETSKSNLNGITKEFYENGDLKVEWNYKNDLLNGISKEYHINGTYSEWNYENGQLIGGSPISKVVHFFKNSILKTEKEKELQ